MKEHTQRIKVLLGIVIYMIWVKRITKYLYLFEIYLCKCARLCSVRFPIVCRISVSYITMIIINSLRNLFCVLCAVLHFGRIKKNLIMACLMSGALFKAQMMLTDNQNLKWFHIIKFHCVIQSAGYSQLLLCQLIRLVQEEGLGWCIV